MNVDLLLCVSSPGSPCTHGGAGVGTADAGVSRRWRRGKATRWLSSGLHASDFDGVVPGGPPSGSLEYGWNFGLEMLLSISF